MWYAVTSNMLTVQNTVRILFIKLRTEHKHTVHIVHVLVLESKFLAVITFILNITDFLTAFLIDSFMHRRLNQRAHSNHSQTLNDCTIIDTPTTAKKKKKKKKKKKQKKKKNKKTKKKKLYIYIYILFCWFYFWDRENTRKKWEHITLHFTLIIQTLDVHEDENTHRPLRKHAYQLYWIFYHKKWNFSDKKSDNFSYFCSKHRLRVLDEAVLMSTHNLCFWAEIRKIMYTPVNPSFTK